ncbi:MAG: hypothetical protein LDL07_13985 [Desulfarculus sp.]|nr:hypothetical protein [Desulfarculus sp.]
MTMGFWRRPAGAWLATLVLAALLLGLGYELADHRLAPDLNDARLAASLEANRANRLAQENQRLEQRLNEAEARLAAKTAAPGSEEGEAEGPASRVIHRGEAALLLGGRLVVTLEGIAPEREAALLRVKVLGGQEGSTRLAPGGDARFRLDGKVYHLLLKKILTNSVIVTLLAEGGN